MIYILIFVVFNGRGTGTAVAEFNDRESCLVAASELRKQVAAMVDGAIYAPVLFCAAKGVKHDKP